MLKYFALFMAIFGMLISGCAPKVEVAVKKIDSRKVAFIAKQGDYSQVGTTIGELFGWLNEKGIQPAGPPMGIYYDDPKKVPLEKCKWEVCVPVVGEVEPDERVQVKELPEMEVASLLHKGAYDKVGPSWGKLYGWIYRNKYTPAGPGMEVYLNSPDEVPEDSLLTEIQVPVKKK